jgi:transcription elongation GreA/GreB family factor
LNLLQLKTSIFQILIYLQKEKIDAYQQQIEIDELNSYKCAKEIRNDGFRAESLIIEKSYAERVEEIRENIDNLLRLKESFISNEKVSLGSLVKIISIEEKSGEEIEELFFMFHNSLDSVEIDGNSIKTVSINSPIGEVLFFKEIDDAFFCCSREIEVLEIV